MRLRARHLVGAAALMITVAVTAPASAQSRAETLRYVTGAAVNTLDPTMPGTTREAFAVSLATYDRLVAFGKKKLGDNWVFDLDNVRGELAETYDVSPDGLTITFHLRPNAKFQDGTPVTADDVKWSLDRAVSSKSLAGPQLLTGSLTSPDQFKVVDPHTIHIVTDGPSPTLPNDFIRLFITSARATAGTNLRNSRNSVPNRPSVPM